MNTILKRPWTIPIIVFAIASAYFISLSATFPTFYNANSDSALFIIAAKYLRLGHPSPGYPLFTLINAGWLQLTPFWTEVASLTLLNAVVSGAVALVLYLLTRSILAPLLWMCSGLVVSQSTILEQYSMMILFMLGSYYFYNKDKRSIAYAVASFGIMVNHQAAFCILAYLANDVYRHNTLKPFLWSFISLPLLLYIPLANRPPYLLIDGNSPMNYFDYFFGQKGLILGIAIVPPDNLFERLWEFSRLLVGGLGVALILTALAIKKVWKENFVLPLLFILPLFYYLTILSPWAYTYALAGIAFGIVLACSYQWNFIRNVSIAGAIVLIILNYSWYDFGMTLDKDKTAEQFMQSLDELPSDAVILNHKGFMTPMWVMLYNLDNGTNIKSLGWDLLAQYSTRKSNPETGEKEWVYENQTPPELAKAESEGKLYEYSLVNAETLALSLKKVTKEDVEYSDFMRWLSNPHTSRLNCDLKEGVWTC